MSRMVSGNGGRRARRQFSEEFRAGAVRLVLEEGKTVGAVARELDLTPSCLGIWVKHARADRTQGKSGLMKDERAELTRLRQENRILAEERDILKKAVVGSTGRRNNRRQSFAVTCPLALPCTPPIRFLYVSPRMRSTLLSAFTSR